MRIVPHDISDRVARTMQTKANNANPSADIWISRPNTTLISDAFLERQTVFDTPIIDASIAVCHPRYKRDNTMIFVGYISNGKARVTSSVTKVKMDEHTWLQHDFEEDASAISVIFNGKMHTGVDGKIELVTDLLPWVFWVADGVLYGKILDSTDEPITLATANCTDVSAICVTDGSVGGFDFGLIVFFLLAGSVYYRQLIDGVWMDAVPVSVAPSNIVKIAAFRTWDHRVGVQMQTSEGKVHELYTQYMGIGKHNEEHVNIRNIAATGKTTKIQYHDAATDGHVEIPNISAYGYSTWGLSSVPLSAENIDDGTGDFGYYVKITFDHPVMGVEGLHSQFTMKDTFGIRYTCVEAVGSDDYLTVTLKFTNFNVSEGNDLIVTYTAGSTPIYCPATTLKSFTYTFTPEGLIKPDIPIPEPKEAWNLNDKGTSVAIKFTESLIDTTIMDNEEFFKAKISVYDMVPGGTLSSKTRVVTSINMDAEDDTILILGFGSGATNSIQNGVGDISIIYSGGTLCGYGGPVAAFEFTFAPEGLDAKDNPNVYTGRAEITIVSAIGKLTKIEYYDGKQDEGHALISDITATGVLTHIYDL